MIRLHSLAQAPFLPPGHKFYHFFNDTIKVVSEVESCSDASSVVEEDESGNSFSGHGIIGLAHQFEFFFKERDPELYQHLIK